MDTPLTRRLALALAVLQLLTATAVLGYRWMSSSTEVPVGDAVTRYRSSDGSEHTPPPAPAPGPDAGGPGQELPEAAPGPTPEDQPVGETESGSGHQQPADQMLIQAPEQGVYTWATDGWEQAGGLRRDLPERSVRVITLEDDRTWMNRHEYSREHVEEFLLRVSEEGVSALTYRTRVNFGPFGGDQTIEFAPPVRFSILPFEVGQRWQGDWTGPTSGTYTGHTFEHTTLRVGEEDVEVYGIEVRMEMEGNTTGTVVSKIWVSPRYRLTVKESYDQRVRSGPGTYEGRWTITLLSTQPER